MIQTLTSNQNPSCYKELENKQTISFAGVDTNIVIFKVIVLGVNGAYVLHIDIDMHKL